MGWWPFGGWQAASAEELDRLARKCALAQGTLRQCRAANAGVAAACAQLEVSVVHCAAEVMCRKEARAHTRAFTRAVNNDLPYSTCAKHVAAMRRCLRRRGYDPEGPPPAARGRR